jgi:hypothetical protein
MGVQVAGLHMSKAPQGLAASQASPAWRGTMQTPWLPQIAGARQGGSGLPSTSLHACPTAARGAQRGELAASAQYEPESQFVPAHPPGQSQRPKMQVVPAAQIVVELMPFLPQGCPSMGAAAQVPAEPPGALGLQ